MCLLFVKSHILSTLVKLKKVKSEKIIAKCNAGNNAMKITNFSRKLKAKKYNTLYRGNNTRSIGFKHSLECIAMKLLIEIQ